MAGSLIATGTIIATRALAGPIANNLWRVANIPKGYAVQAEQIYNAIPAAIKQKGTTLFFGQQAKQQNPENIATPGVDPLNVPRGTK